MVICNNIWTVVAEYTPANPITLIKCSWVSRQARQAFLAESLWAVFDGSRYIENLSTLSGPEKSAVVDLWRFREICEKNGLQKAAAAVIKGLVGDTNGLHLRLPALSILLLGYKSTNQISIREQIKQQISKLFGTEVPSSTLLKAAVKVGGGEAAPLVWPSLKLDQELALESIEKNSEYFEYFDDSLRGIPKIALILARGRHSSLLFDAPEDWRSNKQIVLAAIHGGGWSLKCCPKFHSDLDVVKEAVKVNGYALEDVSDELKNDRKLTELAIKSNPTSFQFVSPELRSNREFVLWAVTRAGNNLKYVGPNLKDDLEINEKAVEAHGIACAWSCPQIKDNYTAAKRAVNCDGMMLRFASAAIRDNEEIATIAVSRAAMAYKFVSKRLQANKKIALEAVSRSGMMLRNVPQDLLADKDIVMAAVRQNDRVLGFIDPQSLSPGVQSALDSIPVLLGRRMEVADNGNIAYKNVYGPKSGWVPGVNDRDDDEDAVIQVLLVAGSAYRFASERLKHTKRVLKAALSNSFEPLFDAPDSLLDEALILDVVSRFPLALEAVPEKFKSHIDVVLAAVKHNGEALKYASVDMKANEPVVLAAVKSHPSALLLAAPDLMSNKDVILQSCT